jgi:predicted GNAT family acetyltransferase
MVSVTRLQEYLRFQASQHREVVPVPRFTCFFNASDSSEEANYAIPDEEGCDDLQASLLRLQTVFAERDCKPYLQFIEDGFAHLQTVLQASGWAKVAQMQVMVCTPESHRPAPNISGLHIVTLSHESGVEAIRESLDTNILGFDPQAEERATIFAAEEFRQDLRLSRAFTARLHEQAVGAGMFTEIHDELTELVGITTLEPFRRRGIAAALTAYMTQIALQLGAVAVFLIAVDELAGRVYERVGFRPYATRVSYTLSS